LFAAGDAVQIQNINTGVVTITAGTATVTSAGSLALSQWDGGTLYFTTTSAAIFFEITQTISPLTTKGDLFTYSTTDARLAVGANGTILVADSTAATGLKWATTGNFVGCRVYASSAQTISNATDTKLAFANETFDTDSFHSNVTNNTRITIPAGLGGYYRVTANSGFLSNASGRRIMAIALNGTNVSQVETTANASAEPAASLTDIYSLAAADYLEINVYQTSGGNLNTSGAAAREFFQVQRIGS